MADVKLDKIDYIISISSGIIAASIDLLTNTEFGFENAHSTGNKDVSNFIMLISDEDNLASAVSELENKYNNKSDNYLDFAKSDKFGGSKLHHLQDYSHHPTIIGLICSIATEFTHKSYGTNNIGKFTKENITGFKPDSLPEIIFNGAFKWAMHLVSDVAGSSGSIKSNGDGAGIPGPLVSTLKELSSSPVFSYEDKINKLSEFCEDLYDGDKFGTKIDYRTELGFAHIALNQLLSVLLCECIVSALYSIKKILLEINNKSISHIDEFQKIEINNILPWNSEELNQMRKISAISFSAVDLSAAGVKAVALSNGDKGEFIKIFATNINYFGVGRLVITETGGFGKKADKIYNDYKPIAERTFSDVKAKTVDKIDPGVKDSYEKVATTATTIAGIGTPIGFIAAAIGVYKEISTSITEYNIAKEERIKIEAECAEAIELLTEYQDEMEAMVSEYMIDRLTIFGESLDIMDEALASGDTDSFIGANNQIQNKLGRDFQFASTDEFDALMSLDDTFKL